MFSEVMAMQTSHTQVCPTKFYFIAHINTGIFIFLALGTLMHLTLTCHYRRTFLGLNISGRVVDFFIIGYGFFLCLNFSEA